MSHPTRLRPGAVWHTRTMPVFLVRHAHALARTEWHGDDEQRDLSSKGHRQARRLVPVLTEMKPGRVLSSPARRCLDTVEPLADALGRVVEREPLLAEGSGRAAVGLVRSLVAENPVLCSHGDVIPEVLSALVDQDGLDLGPHPRVEKGSVWVLALAGRSDGRFGAASYLPPPGR